MPPQDVEGLTNTPARRAGDRRRGQRKTYLHLRTNWPWTPHLVAAWQTIKALPTPT
jgi:hypothetical protein